MITAEAISNTTNGRPKTGGGFIGHCPAHDDHTPSLSIDDGDNGRPLVNCLAGCPQNAVIDALRDLGAWDDTTPTLSPAELQAMKEKAERAKAERLKADGIKHAKAEKEAKTILENAKEAPAQHDYNIKKGLPLGDQVKRGAWPQKGWLDALLFPIYSSSGTVTSIQAINPDSTKDFLARGRIKGCFYPIGKISGATGLIVIGEGVATVAAVCHVMGCPGVVAMSAGNLEPVAREIKKLAPSAKIVIVADDDQKEGADQNPGLESARKTGLSIGAKVATPGMGRKADFWDVLNEMGADGLRVRIEAAKMATEIKPEIPDLSIKQNTATVCSSLYDFLSLDIPLREPLLSPWLVKQSITMLYAWRGLGKSWLAMSIGYAVATGSPLLNWTAPGKGKVLYVDGELPARTLQDRLVLIVNSFEDEPLDDGFQILTPDLQPDGIMPNLSTTEGQAEIDKHANNADLIIVDNLSCLARSGKENEGESWLPIQAWALRHRAKGRSILFVHHSGKNGQQRGASRREDVLDVVMVLKRPEGYLADEGARFDLLFEKSRNLTGEDVTPLSVALQSDKTKITWKWSPAENAIVDRISELIKDGATRRDIQDETGLSRFALKRLVDQANSTRPHPEKITLPDARKGGAQ